MTFDQFYAKYNNQPVDVDRQYGNQCWDLVALYNELVIGIPASADYGLPTGPSGSAKEVYTNFKDPLPKYFDKLPPSASPQKGDIVVWGFAPDGHIAIFIKGNLNNFDSFDQNWPVGSVAHLQNHNGNNVLGFLRPKGGEDMDYEDAKYSRYAELHRLPSDAEVKGDVGKKPEIAAKEKMASTEWLGQNDVLLRAYPALVAHAAELEKELANSGSDKSKQILADMQAVIKKYGG